MLKFILNKIFYGIKMIFVKFLLGVSMFFIKCDILRRKDFVELMLFEVNETLSNAEKNLMQSKTYEKSINIKNNTFFILDKYGYFIMKKYKSNILDNIDFFLNVYWPIILGAFSSLIGLMVLRSENLFLNIIYVLLFSFVFLVPITISAKREIIKDKNALWSKKEMVDEYIVHIDIETFDIDCFNQEEIYKLQTHVEEYLSGIKKIQIKEMELYYKNLTKRIYIFDIDTVELKNLYKLNEDEINAYLLINNLRNKFFQNNSIKKEIDNT